MKNHPGTLKNHKKNILEPKKNNLEPWKTIKNILAPWKTSLEPWKTNLEPRKTNLEPWKPIKTDLEKWKTNLNPWKPIKTDMEPWKTNLEPSKLTLSCTGGSDDFSWQTDRQTLHHNIYISTSPTSSSSTSRDQCSLPRKVLKIIQWKQEKVSTKINCTVPKRQVMPGIRS